MKLYLIFETLSRGYKCLGALQDKTIALTEFDNLIQSWANITYFEQERPSDYETKSPYRLEEVSLNDASLLHKIINGNIHSYQLLTEYFSYQ